MPATLGNFNVPLFAAKTLNYLVNALPTASRVNRSYEQERGAHGLGDTINLKGLSAFTVQDTPYANMAAIADAVSAGTKIDLTGYHTTGLPLTDIEQAYSPTFYEQHAQRMAYDLANKVDAQVLSVAAECPHFIDVALSAANPTTMMPAADRVLRELGAPDTGVMSRHYAATPATWEKWMSNAAFSQWQGGGPEAVGTQQTGQIGQKYGFMPYASNNLVAIAAAASPTITSGAVNGAFTRGATSIAVDATTLTGTFKRGMVIQIGSLAATAGRAYREQLYAVTADVTAAGNAANLAISPPLRADVADNTVFTQKVISAAGAYTVEPAWHENALALVSVDLPSNMPGAVISAQTHAESGLKFRMRYVYDGVAAKSAVIADILYGKKLVHPDMMVRHCVNLAG